MITAIIPAILYYGALFLMLDFEAAKMGLKGLPKEELPDARAIFRRGWPYILPIPALVLMITLLYWSPETACIYGILIVIATSWMVKGKGMRFKQIGDALVKGVETMPQLGVTICMAAILVGSIELTGVGYRIAGGLVSLAGGSLFLLLVFTAFACIFMGLGMPTSSVYILVAILLAPGLIRAGLDPLVAHFFVFYAGLTAMLTPPVCLVAFVAASIADSPFMKTGWQAMRLGIVVYIVPFMFAYSPELLMIGTPMNILTAVVTALIGVVFLSAGMQGYFLRNTSMIERAILLAAGVTMMVPGWTTDLIGISLGILVSLYQFFMQRRQISRIGH
jgi:TRAP transporter 4TM/12TM fusion protein